MNEERLKEIIDHILSYPNTLYYPNICNELIQAVINLQDKINQLETSTATKDKEMEQLKNELLQLKKQKEDFINWLHTDKEKVMWTFMTGKCFNCQDILIKIDELERGKE